MLQAALLKAGLDAGKHHQQAGDQGEEEDVLHRHDPAVDDGPHLVEDGVDVQQGDAGEATHQFRDQVLPCRG